VSIPAEGSPSTPSTGSARRYVALDSLRGVCACVVVFYHLRTSGHITNSAFVQGGWMFVDFFFVLSGFVMSAGYLQRLAQGFPTATFMVLRLGRVYPLHILMLALYLAMESAAALIGTSGLTPRAPFADGRDPVSWIINAGLVQIFGLQDTLTWNIPSWSIAAEIWTYLLLALAAHRLGGGQRLLAAAAAAVLVSLAVMLALGAPYLDRTFSWSLLRCVYAFGLGILGYRAHLALEARGALSAGLATIGEVAVVAACVWFVGAVGQSALTLACPPLFLIAVLVFAREEGRVSALLRWRVPVYLGTVSYSIYMTHHFVEGRALDVLKLVGRVTGMPLIGWEEGFGSRIVAPGPWTDVLAVLILGLVVAVSTLTHRLVEEPGRRWSRRLAMRHRAGSVETVAPSL
jgi:peptidoglycan/LPS O-acetylase OafA/YrhL